MPRYSDEAWEYIQDSREKKITARSARHTRTHCGKSGSVKFPSDYMTKKEIKAMSGKVESYRLGEPMSWKEFKSMPKDLKIQYIKRLRASYSVPDRYIAEMFGICKSTLTRDIKDLGLSKGNAAHGDGVLKWDRDGWFAWVNGEEVKEEILVEEPVKEEMAVETQIENTDEPESVVAETVECDECSNVVVPAFGEMNFEGYLPHILRSIQNLLGNNKVTLQVKWNVIED